MKTFAALIIFSSLLFAQSRGTENENITDKYVYHSNRPELIKSNYVEKADSSKPVLYHLHQIKPKKELFPDERIFPNFFADGTAQQFSLNKDAFTKQWIGSIGGILRIYQVTYNKLKIQIGIGATVYASLIRQPDVLDVQTAGFFVDLPIEFRFNRYFAVRTGYGHYSAHLVDDGIEALKLHSINYAKDYIPLLAAYSFDERGSFIYGGVRFDTYTIPEYNKRWNVQVGIQGGNYEIISGMKLYGAADIKLKSEVAWATTQSYQIGLRVLDKGSHAIRVAYTYRTGIEDRGQFYKDRVNLSLFGVYFDF